MVILKRVKNLTPMLAVQEDLVDRLWHAREARWPKFRLHRMMMDVVRMKLEEIGKPDLGPLTPTRNGIPVEVWLTI